MTKNCSLGEQSIIHKIFDRDILSRFTPMLMNFLIIPILYKTMSNAQPIMNSLRELNSRLLVEIAEPRKEILRPRLRHDIEEIKRQVQIIIDV